MSSDPILHAARMAAFGLGVWENEAERLISLREALELEAEEREARDWRASVERPEV